MKRLLLLILLAIVPILSPVQAQIPVEKRKEIDKMLQLTGIEKLMGQTKAQMIEGLKEELKDAPGDFWVRFEKKMDTKVLLERIVPLYDKYYTLEDLKAVNAFYESAAGKKVLANLPLIMQESMKIGQEWGAEVARKAALEAAEEAVKEPKQN